MKAMACGAAVLLLASVLACDERGRQAASNRVDSAANQAGAELSEGARDVGNAAEKAGAEVREGASDVRTAAESAAEAAEDYSYEKREEFRRDVSERLDNIDEEISVLVERLGEEADQARKDAIAGVRQARSAVDRRVERLGPATASNWDQAKRNVNTAIDSLVRKIRALQPDAKPMGGTGGPD